MGVKTIITCDVCGKQKGDVNHWWLVWASRQGMWIEPFRLIEADSQPKHICGQECAIRSLNDYMNSITKEK